MRTFFLALLLTTVCFTGADAQMYPMNGGDCNGDGAIDITDATCILNYLFGGGTPPVSVVFNGEVGTLTGTDRFLDNGDGTTTDKLTGLMFTSKVMTRLWYSSGLNCWSFGNQFTTYLAEDIDLMIFEHEVPDFGDWQIATVQQIESTKSLYNHTQTYFDTNLGVTRYRANSSGGYVSEGWTHPLWNSWARSMALDPNSPQVIPGAFGGQGPLSAPPCNPGGGSYFHIHARVDSDDPNWLYMRYEFSNFDSAIGSFDDPFVERDFGGSADINATRGQGQNSGLWSKYVLVRKAN